MIAIEQRPKRPPTNWKLKLTTVQQKALKDLAKVRHFKIRNRYRHRRGGQFEINTGNALKRYGLATRCLIDTPNSTKTANMPGLKITEAGKQALKELR